VALLAYSLALLANFSGLILSVWLGVYIVTRSRASRVAWSSGLTLWVLAVYFANILLFMLSSPAPVSQPFWMHLLFPFWPQESDLHVTGWTLGWAAGMGVFFWYQTTVFIIPGTMVAWRRWSLYAGYALGILTAILQIFVPQLYASERPDPILVDTQRINSIYPLYAGIFLMYSVLSIFNLRNTRRRNDTFIVRKQFDMLIAASLAATAATILSIVGAIPGITIPVFWISSLLVVTVSFLGIGIIRYSAILGQRILRRDLSYSAVGISLVVFLYMSMFLWLTLAYNVPVGIVVFLIPLVIVSHSLTEEGRKVLERLIYDRRTRTLRASLRQLSKLAVEQADLNVVLSRSLEAICHPVLATYGVILVFEGESACPAGSYRWNDGKMEFLRADFIADDVKHIYPGSLPEPFLETTLLVPLYASAEQIGTLLLGRPENGIHYSNQDLELLHEPVESIISLIIKNRRINEYLEQFVRLPLPVESPAPDLIPSAWVEEALKNIYDYAYLGDSPLAGLKQVEVLLNGINPTYLDVGKAVYLVVSLAVEKLRPESADPSEPIPREWHPYFILHDAYFDGLPNRDITSKLYISDGTFHRTRRSAIRAVTRVLSELEIAQG
jgi:hypothetical protein